MFLVANILVDSLDLIIQWVKCGGESDHNPIVLELKGRGRKPPIPFKFNAGWLKDQTFVDLVHNIWIPFDPNTYGHEQ